MKEIKEVIKRTVPDTYKTIEETIIKYETSDGKVYDRKSLATDHENYLKRQKFLNNITKIKCYGQDSFFFPEEGTFYLINSYKELSSLIDQEYTRVFSRNKSLKDFECLSYPQWIYLRYNNNGDYRDDTTIFVEEDIMLDIQKTKEIFKKMEEKL